MKLRFTPILPRRRWATVPLLGLLLAASSGHAQALYNGSNSTLVQTGDLYVPGTFQNVGAYVPTSGTLLIVGGDFLNQGTISGPTQNSLIKLHEPSTTVGHLVTLTTSSLGTPIPNLTLDVPAGTTLGNSGGITGTLTLLNGHLSTISTSGTAYTLDLGTTGTLAGETNAHYVKGMLNVKRSLSGSSPVDFGNSGVTVNPNGNTFSLTAQRRTGLAKVGTSYATNPNTPSNKSIDRIWSLSSATSTSSSAVTMTLSWLSDNDNGLTFSGTNAQVWRSDDSGSTWQRQGAVQDGSSRQVAVNITNLNSLYTVGTTAAPLPVTLTNFQAQQQGSTGRLSWQTASEQRSAFFEVQASGDGAAWRVLQQLPALGTSTTSHQYYYTDPLITRYGTSVVYYRLRQVDQDGSFTYSPVRSVLLPEATTLSLYPNPVKAGATATLAGTTPGQAVQVFDALSRLVLSIPAGDTGTTQLLPPASLPAGSYVVRSGEQVQRLVVE